MERWGTPTRSILTRSTPMKSILVKSILTESTSHEINSHMINSCFFSLYRLINSHTPSDAESWSTSFCNFRLGACVVFSKITIIWKRACGCLVLNRKLSLHLQIYIERYELTGDVSSPSGGDRVNRTANSWAGAFSSDDTATDIFWLCDLWHRGQRKWCRSSPLHVHARSPTQFKGQGRPCAHSITLCHCFFVCNWEAIPVWNPVSE